MKKIGIIGFSEGNGHPFSFSAIINGFDDTKFEAAGWPVIHNYLRCRPRSDFGIKDMTVSHAWMPDSEMAQALSTACDVSNIVAEPQDMVGQVDAVIIARDDWTSHLPLARLFLEKNIPVFIDKPLTLAVEELNWFMPYIQRGKLMTCAGLRNAVELDPVRNGYGGYGGIRSIHCAVCLDWEKYGVHMLDAVFTLTPARPVSVQRLNTTSHESYFVEMNDGSSLVIEMHGAVGPLFRVSVIGASKTSTHDLRDNFSSFKRLLSDFSRMLQTGEPPLPPQDVQYSIQTLISGKSAVCGGKAIPVSVQEC